MIERYSITASASYIADRFSVDVPDYYTPRYNAAPTHLLPVITSNTPAGLSLFYWGTSPEWSKNKMLSEKIINLRTEHIQEKPAIKRAIMRTRCIIPADGFYAWKKVGKKTNIPYRFVFNNNETFSFAGLWEEFEDTSGDQIQTFSMVTVPSNAMASMVTERMPLILSRENEKAWLASSASEEHIFEVIKSAPDILTNYYPVSPVIANTTQNLASMILPTPPSDQHGNLTLFD